MMKLAPATSARPRKEPFAQSAAIYDALYAAKDYRAEAAVYAQYLEPAKTDGRLLVEWGCGTGNFLTQWGRWDWGAIGIEPSDAMRSIALRKRCLVLPGSLGAEISITCDAAVACFAVMCYACLDNNALVRVLRQVRATLPIGGRFAFDIINTEAAQHKLIREHHQTVAVDGQTIQRRMIKRLNSRSKVMTVAMHFTANSPHQGESGWRELHHLRTFSPSEIRDALHQSEFRPVHLGEFRLGSPTDDDLPWSLLVVAEAQ